MPFLESGRNRNATLSRDESTSSLFPSETSTSAVKRQRSVQFSQPSLTSTNAPSMPPPDRKASPDEIMPIVSQDHSGGRNYQTSASREPPTDPTEESTSVRRRAAQPQQSDGDSLQNHGDVHDRPNTTREQQEDEEVEQSQPWYKRIAEKYGSVELENKGSVARDHLALERTFLAWLRTSLAFASIGIAITQLFRLNTTISQRSPNLVAPLIANTPKQSSSMAQSDVVDAAARLRQVGKPLGAIFLAIAILVLFVGFHRYFESQHWIIRGKFPASRGSVALITAVAGALIVGSMVVVIVIAPSSLT